MERLWLKNKLNAGVELLEYRDAHLPLDLYHWTRDVSVYESTHPLQAHGMGLEIRENFDEPVGPHEPQFIVEIIDSPKVVASLEKDPASWLYEYQGKVYWRWESYSLYYRKPDTIVHWRNWAQAELEVEYSWEIAPEEWAFLTNVLIELDQIAQSLGSHDPLTKKWLEADLHPIAKK